jgi:hypothetical protein
LKNSRILKKSTVEPYWIFSGIKCKLESGEPPDPDLLFRHEGRRIGVEDTQLFAEDGSARRTPQKRKTHVDKIAAATQLEYEKRGYLLSRLSCT